MINQLILVGRIVNDVTVKSVGDGKKVADITLAVQGPYKNEQNEYEPDYIKFALWDSLATATAEYMKKGSVLCVKGRLKTKKEKYDEEKYRNVLEVVAEKVTFISSKKE